MKGKVRKDKKFSSDEISIFCDQIAMLLNGGIPLYEGTYLLYNEMEDNKTKDILKQVVDKIHKRIPLHQSLAETHAFPDYMIYMVKIGETTGKLEEVMRSLSSYYERESNVKASIRSAVIYPLVLFAIMATILLTLVYKILPFFESMFEELNAEVATSTVNRMAFGVAAGRTMAITVCVILFIVIIVMIWYCTNKGKLLLKSVCSKLKIMKNLAETIATGKFVSSMALMVASGMDHEEALDLAYDASDNKVIQNKIRICKDLIHKNISLEGALSESKLFLGMEAGMIRIAAKSGAMDSAFEKLGEQYNAKITGALSKLATYLETILVITITTMIGIVLISVMLPLVSILSAIG